MDEELNKQSQIAHERLVYQVTQKAKASQALRNIENGVPLASDSHTLRNFIKNAR